MLPKLNLDFCCSAAASAGFSPSTSPVFISVNSVSFGTSDFFIKLGNLSLQLFFFVSAPVASDDPSSFLFSKVTDSSLGFAYSSFGFSHTSFLACLLLTKGDVLSSSVPTGTNISIIFNL